MLTIASSWELDVQRGPDWLIVKVRTDPQAEDSQRRTNLAGTEPEPFAEVVWELMQRHFSYRLVLEMDQVGLLSSHLIGELVRLYKRIREHDGVMRLCGLSPHNLRVLRACRLDDRFQPYHDCKEAVLGSGRVVHPR